MDEKYLWPLVGVVLGWFLTFLATGLKERQERRKLVGRLLPKLMRLQSQVGQIIAVTESFKDHADDWKHYESYRKSMSDRHFLEPAVWLDSLNKTIEDLSSIYPLEALALSGFVDVLMKSKATSLSASSSNKDLYIQLISAHEVALESCEKALARHVQRVAFMHGVPTYLRLRIRLLQEGKRKARNAAFLKQFAEEAYVEIHKVA